MDFSQIPYGFTGFLLAYLVEPDAETGPQASYERKKAFYKELYDMYDALEKELTLTGLKQMAEFITSSEFVHKAHSGDLKTLRTELPGLTDEDIFALFSVVFGVWNRRCVSLPVQKLLVDRLPALLEHVARKTFAPLVLRNKTDLRRFEDALCETLAEFALMECPNTEFYVWGESDPVLDAEPAAPDYAAGEDEFVKMCCHVFLTDGDTLLRVKNASYLAAYRTEEPEKEIMLIGNLITFASADGSDALTLQVTGYDEYDNYEEMFTDIGTAAFGCPDKEPFECAKKTKKRYADCMSGGPLGLRVKRLASPILGVADLETLRKNGKRDLYFKRYRADDYVHAETEPTLITDCCSLEVGNCYRYCPNCGKRIDIVHCKKGKTLLGGFEAEMFDYATWICACGKGYERYKYRFCPVCGRNREQTEGTQ